MISDNDNKNPGKNDAISNTLNRLHAAVKAAGRARKPERATAVFPMTMSGKSCLNLIPEFDGAISSSEWKDALCDKF